MSNNKSLFTSFVKAIEKWDWSFLKYKIGSQHAELVSFPAFNSRIKTLLIGTVASMYPSGTRPRPLAESRNESQLNQDIVYHKALNSVANTHGMRVSIGDDPNDVYLEVIL